MARSLSIAALLSALTTLVAAMALRAADATLAVAAVAAVAVLFTWYAQLHSTAEQSSVGLSNPAATVALAVVGRRPWATVLPAVAAHVVGAVAGGLLALVLDDQLGDTLVFTDPGLALTAVAAVLVGVLGAWTTLSIDGGGPEALAAVPTVVGGAILPLGLLTVFHPAAVIGLATAGLVPWDVALVAAGAALVGAAVGAFTASVLVPVD
jgi:glycerol uptake facilitator-like aquaporin